MIDHVHAAALPLAALTAWQSLTETANLRAGQRVLIHAAAGGFGHVAVQVAKAHGAYVLGTAREAKHAFLRGLGADELIDYTRVDFADAVHDIDIVSTPVTCGDRAANQDVRSSPAGTSDAVPNADRRPAAADLKPAQPQGAGRGGPSRVQPMLDLAEGRRTQAVREHGHTLIAH